MAEEPSSGTIDSFNALSNGQRLVASGDTNGNNGDDTSFNALSNGQRLVAGLLILGLLVSWLVSMPSVTGSVSWLDGKKDFKPGELSFNALSNGQRLVAYQGAHSWRVTYPGFNALSNGQRLVAKSGGNMVEEWHQFVSMPSVTGSVSWPVVRMAGEGASLREFQCPQ